MWYHDLLWGLWNGLTAWIVLIVHLFGRLENQPLYDVRAAGTTLASCLAPGRRSSASSGDASSASVQPER